MSSVAGTSGTFRAAAAGLIVIALAAGGAATGAVQEREGPRAVAAVIAGDLVRLDDGRAVRLAGIRVPAAEPGDPGTERVAEQVRAALRRLLEGQLVTLAPAEASYDRYGRLVAHLERSDGLWVQGALLERGLAQVQTRPGETARVQEMLTVEHGARAARRGLWALPAFMPQDAGAIADSTGRFGIVRGRVLRVAPTDNHVYLNFGTDWRADFTVRVQRAELKRAFAGIDLEGLAGRLVEVRGVVLEAGGPLIELSHPEQMQVLP
jgi:micrococcal nuclease